MKLYSKQHPTLQKKQLTISDYSEIYPMDEAGPYVPAVMVSALSAKFLIAHYLKLSEEEILDNERLLVQEQMMREIKSSIDNFLTEVKTYGSI